MFFICYFLDIKCRETEEIEIEMTVVTLVFREIQGGEAVARKIMGEKEDIATNTEEIIPAMMKDTDQGKDIEGVVT